MFLKSCGLLVPLVGGGLYVAGVFDAGYQREVDRPPGDVMTALADLDITAQPGSPGTDPSRSGGVAPLFRLDRAADRMTWTVLSGGQVATRMTAIVEPLDGGARSRVTALVERGDAPDDFVSPAFRSEGLTMGLFGMALEGELNELVAPPAADPAKCEALMEKFGIENNAAGFAERPANLTQAIGQTAQVAMRLQAMEAELRRNGCKTSKGGGGFVEASSRMVEGGDSGPPPEGVTFESGKPMVDLSRN